MLTQQEFEKLKTRVAEGKKFLDGKWGNQDRETREWVRLWMDLSDQLHREMAKRNMFTRVGIATLKSAEEHLERIREQAIAKGYITQSKERRKRNDTARSDSNSLFESSPSYS